MKSSARYAPIPKELDEASDVIIGAAIEVHSHLGPGLLESIYEEAMVHELELRGIGVRQQVSITIDYKGLLIEGQRMDLLVDPGIIVELKAIDCLLPIHEAHVLSYLKSTKLRLGLLLNFNGITLKHGIKRIVN